MLTGRERCLALLAARLRDLAAGRGGVVLVEGAAGTGRSRLLAEAASLAASRGLGVAAAAADELTAAAPLGTLTGALRGGASPVLTAAALEELAAAAGDHRRLLGSLCHLLAARARSGPLLIALDDLQWADPLTLMALTALPRELAGHAVLWLASRRLLSSAAHADQAFDTLARAGAERLVLDDLDPAARVALVRELAGAPPHAGLDAALAAAGGNPAYLVDLLRGLDREGRLTVVGGEARMLGERPPARLVALVGTHLRHLSPDARHLLDVGSVLGRELTVGRAATLLGRPPAEVRPALAEALAAHVLRDEGTSLTFRHELVRRIVLDRLPEAVRHALHRDAGRLLLAESAGAPATARHLAVGADAGDEEVIGVLLQAAFEVVQSAPGAAADLFLRALSLLSRDDARRRDVLAFVVPLLGATGRLDEVEPLATAALDEGLGPEAEVLVRLGLAAGLARAGMTVAAGHHVRRGLERAEATGGPAASLLASQAALLIGSDLGRSARVAAEAVREAEASDRAEAAVGGRTVQACVALHRGRLTQAAMAAARAADTVDVGARLWHPGRVLAVALIGLGRFDEALTVIGAARRDAVALGSEWFLAVCRNLEALVHLGSGRLDDAATSAAAALADMPTMRLEPVEAQARAVLAEVAIRRGDLALARAHAGRAVALADDVWDLSTARWAAAWLEGAEEHPGPAPALDRAIAGLRHRRLVLAAVDPARLPLLVRIAGERGEAEHARIAADAARLLAERNPGVRSIAGIAAHAEGLLHGDGTLLAGAVELLRAGPRPLALAAALEDLGQAPVATRAGRAQGVAALEEAHERFAAAGAARDAARVRWLLRERGTRRQLSAERYRPAGGWESLTQSEQATVRLAADGLTNGAIARRLFVSPNTIGTHLRHAYAKLGVRSRVDLTRAVMRSLDDARD